MILMTLIFALVYVSMLTAYKLRLRGQNQNWSKDIAYQLISKEWFSTRRDTLRDLENFCWQRSETVTCRQEELKTSRQPGTLPRRSEN